MNGHSKDAGVKLRLSHLVTGLLIASLLGCGSKASPSAVPDPSTEAAQPTAADASQAAHGQSRDTLPPQNESQPSHNTPSSAEPAAIDEASPSPATRKKGAVHSLNTERFEAAGMHKVTGERLTLWTDLPITPEIAALPAEFDAACTGWGEYFHLAPGRLNDWHVTGYLLGDRERCRAAGLEPEGLPPFLNGFARGNEIWLNEQPSAYYRRHLLLHEGTHSLMFHLFGGCGPPWYMEGMAELLGTHRMQGNTPNLGSFPQRREDVPYWGRIKLIADAVREGQGLSLDDVLAFQSDAFLDNRDYAWSWAAAAFLDGHPRYRDQFRSLPSHLRGNTFDLTLPELYGADWQSACDEWRLFISELDYGYDLARAALEFKAGRPIQSSESCMITADRGWQNTGIVLEAGKRYRLDCKGHYQVADVPRPWMSEPGGVSIRYVRGKPLGVVLAAVVPLEKSEQRVNGLLEPLVIGESATITSAEQGTLFLRINDSPSELDDNAGTVRIDVVEVP